MRLLKLATAVWFGMALAFVLAGEPIQAALFVLFWVIARHRYRMWQEDIAAISSAIDGPTPTKL